MPVDHRAPNINARRLGWHLRKLRELLELSYDAAAGCLGCEVDWLIRVETGFELVTPEKVGELLDGYGVPQHKLRTMLIDLASRPAGPPWLNEHACRMKALMRDLITLEAESPHVHTYGLLVIPELAQTPEYARKYFACKIPEVDVDLECELLDSRQRHLPGGRRRTLDIIVDEFALRLQSMPPETVRCQIAHLIELSHSEHATVRVIAASVGAHAGLKGAFDVMEFPDLNDRVSLVYTALGVDLARADLTDTWHLLEEVASSPEESRASMAQIMADIPDTWPESPYSTSG